MGRQIEFYMNKSVDKAFLSYLQENNYIFYYFDRETKKTISTCSAEALPYHVFLCRKSYEKIVYYDAPQESAIDIFKSDIIQLSRTIIDETKKRIIKGRIWVPTTIYDASGNSLGIPDEMRLDYNRLVIWIKKNVPYINVIKRGNISEREYQLKYYANEDVAALTRFGYELK